jgi:xanthine dehydrogenase accessory factor
MNPLIVIRGGGDLASGVALRLFRTGHSVVILELDKPLAVRRKVSFSEAVYEESTVIEGVRSRLVSPDQLMVSIEAGEIPVLVDPNAYILRNQFLTSPQSTFLVDARLLKTPPEALDAKVPLHIGLGPGFVAGENCTAVVETRRGHTLGRLYWEGSPAADSRQPEGDARRVLRAPRDGTIKAMVEIGDRVRQGQLIAEVVSDGKKDKSKITSPLDGVLRGLIRPEIQVAEGMKIGDVDEVNDRSACFLVSDKALAVGGAVLEAVLMKKIELDNLPSV